ncbi:phosphatidylethanolamine N-methyltransferase isoform X2 [Phocoena sinus]|uniref:Phosphatidylethanolamine N-methyltransferase n=1 Tax=Phocoena sinus TaxID=42100 RepID=A0A8C9E2R5_PHOSS|nr:phosphatidylethanolamine N-methyltransferase isoform X2 [Phocoena sinus]
MGPVLAVGGCREARTWSLQGGPRPTGPGRAGSMCSSVAAPDCCGGLGNLDFRKADLCIMTRLLGYVDPSEPHFVAAVLTIAFNPLFWNVVARWEHKTRKLSGAFGSPHLACCTLGGAILLLNVLRSHCFTQAMLSQPRMQSLDNPLAYRMGLALLGVGGVFVLSSFLALGFTGTFLGDYFGILKETRVTTFPFSVLDNPMYWGSTANYLGWAIMHASPAGLLLDHGSGAHLHGRHPVTRSPFTAENLPAESLPGPQEELTGPRPLRGGPHLGLAPSTRPLEGRGRVVPGLGRPVLLEMWLGGLKAPCGPRAPCPANPPHP